MIKELNQFQNELVEQNGKLYQIKIEFLEFNQIENHIKLKLVKELTTDKNASRGLLLMNVPENHQIEQFGICRYGGFDKQPDFDGDNTNHEWYNCGKRGHCPGEGLVCKSMKAEFGLISPRMIQYLGFATQGLTDEGIAVEMGIKVTTVRTLKKRCLEATGLANKTSLVAFSKDKNIG